MSGVNLSTTLDFKMIKIDEYDTAIKWLEEQEKDATDTDVRQQFSDLIEVLEHEHEEAEKVEPLQDAIDEIRDTLRGVS